MQRSVFGAKIPDLSSEKGINKIVDQGYDLGFMPNNKNLRDRREMIEAGIVGALSVIRDYPVVAHASLEYLAHVVDTVSSSLLDTVFARPEGMQFYNYSPSEETSQFAKLLTQSMLSGTSLPIVSSTCPDYEPRSYRLRDGVGIFAERTLRGIAQLHEFFLQRGISISTEMHLADGDAADGVALQATGESHSTFLAKINTTIDKIAMNIARSNLAGSITVKPMSSIFEDGIIGYARSHRESTIKLAQLYKTGNKRVNSTVKNLLKERESLGDFDEIVEDETRLNLVLNELAGYDAYGSIIRGRALVLSPGAKSVVPAYNFSPKEVSINPVIYVYDKRERYDLYQ